MKNIILFLFIVIPGVASSQNPKLILNEVIRKFSKVQDYSADVNMQFDIPNVKMDGISGKVYYKKPDKFRVKSKGIAFVPKQNPYFSLNLLKDTSSYIAIMNGSGKVQNVNCRIINVIPNIPTDMVIGKFWVDVSRNLVLKSQITTNSNGTLNIENFFGSQSNLALPDKMVMTIEMTKFKLPKALSAELNSKSSKPTGKKEKGIGKITMQFNGYQLNKKLSNAVFSEKN